jgi:hypothetical protein
MLRGCTLAVGSTSALSCFSPGAFSGTDIIQNEGRDPPLKLEDMMKERERERLRESKKDKKEEKRNRKIIR